MGRADSRINSENPAFFSKLPEYAKHTGNFILFKRRISPSVAFMRWSTISERSGGLSCSDSGEFKVEGGPRHVKVASKNSTGGNEDPSI